MQRTKCEERLEAYLDKEAVQYHKAYHRTAYTARALARAEHIHARQVAKVVVATGERGPFLSQRPITWTWSWLPTP